MLLARDHSTHRTDNSRASEQPNQHRSIRHRGSWINQFQLARWRFGSTNPTRRWENWMNHFQLAQRQVGWTTFNSPNGELDWQNLTHRWASWMIHFQLAQSSSQGSFNPSNGQFPSIGTTKQASPDPPSGKLDKPSLTRPTAGWIGRSNSPMASWTSHF